MIDFLQKRIKDCKVCSASIPFTPNPVLQVGISSRIVIVGQAPGLKAHLTNRPWNDASGKKLKSWLNVSDDEFYNNKLFSIIPIGFCYPGKSKNGDLPPRKECAPLWHNELIGLLTNAKLILLIGVYAQKYYLKNSQWDNLTSNVRNYKSFLPTYFPLPHPSPRNQNWLKINPWFSEETIPFLQKLCRSILEENIQ